MTAKGLQARDGSQHTRVKVVVGGLAVFILIREAAQRRMEKVGELVKGAEKSDYDVEPAVAHDAFWWKEKQQSKMMCTMLGVTMESARRVDPPYSIAL